jgi:hypothetical protein
MPRVLLPGEPDTTSAADKQEVMNVFQQTMESIMAKHNTAFLDMFRQMMVGVFGPGMEKVLGRLSPQGPSVEIGESSAAVNSQPARDASAQPPLQSTGRSTNPAASAKRGRSANPAASAKHERSANSATKPLSRNAQ